MYEPFEFNFPDSINPYDNLNTNIDDNGDLEKEYLIFGLA